MTDEELEGLRMGFRDNIYGSQERSELALGLIAEVRRLRAEVAMLNGLLADAALDGRPAHDAGVKEGRRLALEIIGRRADEYQGRAEGREESSEMVRQCDFARAHILNDVAVDIIKSGLE